MSDGGGLSIGIGAGMAIGIAMGAGIGKKKAKEMCGPGGDSWRVPPKAETEYLNALVRGVYAVRDLPAGRALTDDDVYLAIPLQKGQISCRELMRGEVLLTDVAADAPIGIGDIDRINAI